MKKSIFLLILIIVNLSFLSCKQNVNEIPAIEKYNHYFDHIKYEILQQTRFYNSDISENSVVDEDDEFITHGTSIEYELYNLNAGNDLIISFSNVIHPNEVILYIEWSDKDAKITFNEILADESYLFQILKYLKINESEIIKVEKSFQALKKQYLQNKDKKNIRKIDFKLTEYIGNKEPNKISLHINKKGNSTIILYLELLHNLD